MDTKTLKHREPVWWFHVAASVVIGAAAVLTNVIGNVPADANWLVIGGLVVRSAAAYGARNIAWSPDSVARILRQVGLTSERVDSIIDDASKPHHPGTGAA